MLCAECGERLLDGARFCTACGRRAGAVVVCPQCQTQAPDGAKFCFNCGNALGEQAVAPSTKQPEVPAPQRVEPRLDKAPERGAEPEPHSGGGSVRREPTVQRPAASSSDPAGGESAPRDLRKTWPLGIVILGALLAAGAYWSAARDDATAKAEGARRVANATGPLPTTQEVAPGRAEFSTRQALQGLYGGYDPHLDGAFWKVTGAPSVWGDWNGRRVFIKPLVSRSDESGTRHVVVTNSIEVRDGLVVKEGTGCRECKSLLGAALFERRDGEWVLVTEHRFLRIAGAWGAPPKVDVDFPRKGGVEVRIENATRNAGQTRKSVQAIVLHAGKPARAAPQQRDMDAEETSIAAR
jgi:hypothetical protein